MEDIFYWTRKGDILQVRLWADDPEHDLNHGDDHQFSPLHWASKCGHLKVVELLLAKGARAHTTNMGDDTPLHLASAHGHFNIVSILLNQKVDVNFVNEHGNTALHYSCFWNYPEIAEELVRHGAFVNVKNKYGQCPVEKGHSNLNARLLEIAVENGQDLKRREFQDQSWLGLKTRSRDATLSRHKGININEISLQNRLSTEGGGFHVWRGKWQGNQVAARVIHLTPNSNRDRFARDFDLEFPQLRIFSHKNISGVLGCCNAKPNLVVLSSYMPLGSLYSVLHLPPNRNNKNDTSRDSIASIDQGLEIIIDSNRALQFALDIAQGMDFLQKLNKKSPPTYRLSSKSIVIECISQPNASIVNAKLNMGDATFSFEEKGRLHNPQWMAPELLAAGRKSIKCIDLNACDMWSFAIVLWEMCTREPPFAHFSPMEAGMKIALEGLRVDVDYPGISRHISKLTQICMFEDASKRPTFEQVVNILEKMIKYSQ